MTAQVFLSYRRADSAGQAGRLHDNLAGLFGDENVFIDVSDLPAGRPFPRGIEEAINQSAVLLVVIGPRWMDDVGSEGRRIDNRDDWVRQEIVAALELAKPTLPVLVGGARLPASDSLPPDIARFSEYGAIEITDTRWSYDVGRLFKALADLGVVPPTSTAFPLESCGRVDVRGAWLGARDPSAVRREVHDFLTATRVSAQVLSSDTMTIRGGSRWRTRIFGVPLTKPEDWPIRGKLRLSERGARLQVEILLCENWGAGFLDLGTVARYRDRLESIITDLREATGG